MGTKRRTDGSRRDEECCFCDFRSSLKAVRAHIPVVHADLLREIPRGPGRPGLKNCSKCGGLHSAILAPGRVNRPVEFRRGNTITLTGNVEVNPDPARPGRGEARYSFPPTRIPKNAKTLESIRHSVVGGCRGPFEKKRNELGQRFCIKHNRFHFDPSETEPRMDSLDLAITHDGPDGKPQRNEFHFP